MAAVTLTLGQAKTTTLHATAGHGREVVIPKGARWVYLRARTGDLRYGGEPRTGVADDTALADGTYITLSTSQSLFSLRVPGTQTGGARSANATSVVIAGSTSSAVVELLAVAEDGA